MDKADFLRELGPLALGSRLRRLSDSFLSDVEKWYRMSGIEVAPRCMPVLLYLRRKGPSSIKEIARGLGLTHSAVSQLVTILKKHHMVRSSAGSSDARVRSIVLMKKGEELVHSRYRIRDIVTGAVEEVLRDADSVLLEQIEKLEAVISEKNFLARLLECEKRNHFSCIPFSEDYLERVQKMVLAIQRDEFGIQITLEEQPDLVSPRAFFTSHGGGFWLAVKDEEVVGTVGLLNIGDGDGALRKMFVRKDHRGVHPSAAKALLDIAVEHAGKVGMKRILLGTTDRFKAAHAFYEKNGFERISVENLPPLFPRVSVDTVFYFKKLG